MVAEYTAIVVDDDDTLGTVFKMGLELLGFTAHHVSDSRTAITEIERLQSDLIVLDMNMPHVTGKEVLQQIREHESLAAAKVIIVTANARAAEELEQTNLADLVLVKPVTMSQIKDMASRLIGIE